MNTNTFTKIIRIVEKRNVPSKITLQKLQESSHSDYFGSFCVNFRTHLVSRDILVHARNRDL